MKMTVLAAGRLKEKYWKDAAAEYIKRLSRYCTVNIIETADEKTRENLSEGERERIVGVEGRRMLPHIREEAFVVALAIDGERMSSEEMARLIEKKTVAGVSHIQWIIGGSLGLSEEILRKADLKMSFSALTFPHQLMRVILLEQLYRSFRLIRREPYHK